MRWRTLWLLLVLVVALAACDSTPPPTPTAQPSITPSHTPRVPRITPPPQRATLPPTFTPTFTPTVTDTPTITYTPSITPTPTPIPVAVLCEGFDAFFNQNAPDGLRYSAGDALLVQAYLNIPSAVFRFVATNTASAEQIVYEQPGGSFYTITLPPERFPASGRWDWSASVGRGDETGLCEETGFFFIDNTPRAETTAAVDAPVLMPTPTASAETEATAERLP